MVSFLQNDLVNIIKKKNRKKYCLFFMRDMRCLLYIRLFRFGFETQSLSRRTRGALQRGLLSFYSDVLRCALCVMPYHPRFSFPLSPASFSFPSFSTRS